MANTYSSCLITSPNWRDEAEVCCQRVLDDLGGEPDVVILFVSPHFQPELQEIAAVLQTHICARHMLGCIGDSIASDGQEIEGDPAIAVWAARLPTTMLESAHLKFERTADGGRIAGWPVSWPSPLPADSVLLVLGAPFSFPPDLLLAQLENDHPAVPVIGGMASGFHEPEKNHVLLGDAVHVDGAVVLLIQGEVSLKTVVSQGCRPIDKRFVITKVERNVILELGGKPAIDVLEAVFASLPTSEQESMRQGFHLGRVVSEYQDEYAMGDFIIRNVVGLDTDQEGIVVADYFKVGQTVQFHLRDEESADHELRQLLKQTDTMTAQAALLFTCNGRGTRMFAEPHHDTGVIKECLGEIPLAGFFAQGEIGPVGEKNFVHGFTASVLIFE